MGLDVTETELLSMLLHHMTMKVTLDHAAGVPVFQRLASHPEVHGYICVQAELAKSAQAAAQAKLSKAEEAAAAAAQKLKVHPGSSPECLDSLPFTAAIKTCSFRSGSHFSHDQGHAKHMGRAWSTMLLKKARAA
jgi:hypothetical protein